MTTWSPRAATVEAFTCGDCWALAVEVRRLTGYPLVFVSPYAEDHDADLALFGWEHVAVRLPDGNILDVLGPQPPHVWFPKWNAHAAYTTNDQDEIDYLLDGQTRAYPQANPRATARRILNHFNIPTTGRRHRDALPLPGKS